MKKGAFVQLLPVMTAQVPNVVIFQFNPESLRHAWTQGGAAATAAPAAAGSNPLAAVGLPGETFSFSLTMDATDQGPPPPTGLLARLSALEMLLHPSNTVDDLINGLTGGGGRTTPSAQLPAVLFVWGTARIVPVRITSLTVTEKIYDEDLNPIHADAQLELKVLTPDELASAGTIGQLGTAAYKYTLVKRVAGAAANLGAGAADIIGMLASNHILPG